jgi:hypothetical protein
MYVPEPFKEERIDVLHDAIRRAGLEMNMTNGRLGHFLNRRMASLTIAGAIAAADRRAAAGCFSPVR